MKENIHFTSLNSEEYPDIDKAFEVIENPAEQLSEYADTEQTPITAQKQAVVQARSAKLGEVVSTGPIVEIDGKKYRFVEAETTVSEEMVNDGAMIIKNPDGEFYFNKNRAKFEKQYGEVQNGGTMSSYASQGGAKPFLTATKDVKLMKPDWGQGAFQVVPAGSMICVEDMQSPYSVTNSAFAATYQKILEREIG